MIPSETISRCRTTHRPWQPHWRPRKTPSFWSKMVDHFGGRLSVPKGVLTLSAKRHASWPCSQRAYFLLVSWSTRWQAHRVWLIVRHLRNCAQPIVSNNWFAWRTGRLAPLCLLCRLYASHLSGSTDRASAWMMPFSSSICTGITFAVSIASKPSIALQLSRLITPLPLAKLLPTAYSE